MFVEPISGEANFEMQIQFSFVNKYGKTLYLAEEKSPVLKINFWKMEDHWGIKQFIPHKVFENKKVLFPDQKLHCRIEVYHIRPPSENSILYEKTKNFKTPINFKDPFEMMVNNESENIIFDTDNSGTKLNFNKKISFEKMKIGKNLEVTRFFDKKVILELLRFITFNQVVDIETINLQLLECALFYEVKDLPEKCMKSIIEELSADNILQVIYTANLYDFEILFGYCCEAFQM